MKNIILVGMMGSGKTSIGKLLAEELGFKLIDTDVEVEKKNKMTINEIFKKMGKMGFRYIEEEVVEQLGRSVNRVIATGGGTIMSPKNYNLFRRNGDMVYLKASAEEIYNRVKGDKTRPLLQTSDPLKTIQELIEKRSEIYEKASITVSTDGKTPEEITTEILENLENHGI